MHRASASFPMERGHDRRSISLFLTNLAILILKNGWTACVFSFEVFTLHSVFTRTLFFLNEIQDRTFNMKEPKQLGDMCLYQ